MIREFPCGQTPRFQSPLEEVFSGKAFRLSGWIRKLLKGLLPVPRPHSMNGAMLVVSGNDQYGYGKHGLDNTEFFFIFVLIAVAPRQPGKGR